METVNPFNLAQVNYRNKSKLPASPGIYYVLNLSANEIVYIGQSKNIRARWNNHHRSWDIGMIQAIHESIDFAIAWEYCEKESLTKLEKQRIKELRPLLNGKNDDETESLLFGEDDIQNSPQYFRYLTNAPSPAVIDSISELGWKYLTSKAEILELFNYTDSCTNKIIPHYKFFENDCLINYCVNASKDLLYEKAANEIYELINDDLRVVMDFFLSECEDSFSFSKIGWPEKRVVETICFLFGHFLEADIKAIHSITPIQDFPKIFLERIEDESVEVKFLQILRPIYRKVAKRNWEIICNAAVVEFDGKLYDKEELSR